jgi:N utilization substance protein A
LLCDMIGRAIVLVKDDQLSQAIGKYGQNVRLASKLVGWDIEIMTASELEDQIDRAVGSFMELEGMTEDLAQRLVEQGYLSYDDLSVIEPDALMEMGGLSEEEVDALVEQADERAAAAEVVAEEQKRLKKQLKMMGGAAAVNTPVVEPAVQVPVIEEVVADEIEVADDGDVEVASELAEGMESASGDDVEASEVSVDEVKEDETEPNLVPEQEGVDSPAADAPGETMDQTNVADRN